MKIWDLFKPKKIEKVSSNKNDTVYKKLNKSESVWPKIQVILETAETVLAFQKEQSVFVDEIQEIVDTCHDIESLLEKYESKGILKDISPLDEQTYICIKEMLKSADKSRDNTCGPLIQTEQGLKAAIANLKEYLEDINKTVDYYKSIEKDTLETNFVILKSNLSISSQLELNDRIANEMESDDLDIDR